MARARANGIEIEYETFGDPAAPPLVLVMGLGAQMIAWRDELCRDLADRGLFVVRFDNRDVGLSSKMDDAGQIDVPAVLMAIGSGNRPDVPYTLDDMADDTVGLMDALGLDSAHVCGASMGGMIAQTVAIRHPDRVRSLISIMSTTGDPALPQATPAVSATLMQPPATDRDAYLDQAVTLSRTIGSTGFELDVDEIRANAARAFDRGLSPAGVARQFAAVLAHGDRTARLREIDVPTLVIHGKDDPLIPWQAGEATADAIRGARLLLFDGMGHDLPRQLWPEAEDAIQALIEKAEADR